MRIGGEDNRTGYVVGRRNYDCVDRSGVANTTCMAKGTGATGEPLVETDSRRQLQHAIRQRVSPRVARR
jgi:hypothetical protein